MISSIIRIDKQTYATTYTQRSANRWQTLATLRQNIALKFQSKGEQVGFNGFLFVSNIPLGTLFLLNIGL